MSEGKPAKLNIEEKLMACIELAQNRQDDIQALRDERDQLREALREIAYDDIDLMQARAGALTALTPAEGRATE